jgi:hypothetical protein
MAPEEQAAAIARSFGLRVSSPLTLSDSNNVVVWLRPSPVVAKVGTGHYRRLALELSVAQHLVSSGAPVVPPAGQIPRQVYRGQSFEVTFWAYQDHYDREPGAAELALALREVHGALLGYEGPLPSFQDELDDVATLLADEAFAPALGAADRELLSSALERFAGELRACEAVERPLHGSPHSANVLFGPVGPRFIDFETACKGPFEWDLAHLGDDAVGAYPDRADPRALRACRALVSVKTAARCWGRFEHPGLRWHARHHLSVIRRLMGVSARLRGTPP